MSGLCFFADYLLATVKRETTVAYMSGHVGSRELQRAFGEVLNGRAQRPCERVLAAHFWTSRSPDGERSGCAEVVELAHFLKSPER
jgi:hypothetical protein